ncbi:MAG: eukaryotic translation initiation factor 3 subunit E [Treponema sp.]|nr:eukaryotic translation initiation factor 3 subunit E [Treponema sp.]
MAKRKILWMILGIATLYLASCETYRYYPVPEEWTRGLTTTIEMPDIPIDEVCAKLVLSCIDIQRIPIYSGYRLEIQTKERDLIIVSVNISMSEDIEASITPGLCRLSLKKVHEIWAKSETDALEKFNRQETGWKLFINELSRRLLISDEIEKLYQEAFFQYENRGYSSAADYFYKIAMLDPNDEYAILLYGDSLSNTSTRPLAIKVYDLIPNNEIAQEKKRVIGQEVAEAWRVQIAQEAEERERQRVREEERKRQQAEAEEQQRQQRAADMAALSDSLVGLAGSIAQLQQNNTSTATSAPATSIGNQASSSNSTSSSGGSSHIANNSGAAQRNYNTLSRAAEGHYNNLVKALENDSSSPTQSHSSRIRELERNLRDCQRQMRELRAEAERQGVRIGASYYETVSP